MTSRITTVEGVFSALRGWQDFHMDGKGWSDIAYQLAIDSSGNRYELRGLATTSGANGDLDVNQRFGAVLLILAPGEPVSDAMAAQARRVVAEHRSLFPRSDRLVGHSDIRPEPTECPGPVAHAALRAGRFDPQEELTMDKEVRAAFDELKAEIGEVRDAVGALRVKEAGRHKEQIRELRSQGKTADEILDTLTKEN
jgi:hypothetical protein